MSKKLDLDLYLAKYQTDEYKRKPITNDNNNFKHTSPIITNNFRSNSKPFEEMHYTPQRNDYMEMGRTVTNREAVSVDFHNSQAECLSFLQQIRRKLAEEESELVLFMETYQRQLEDTLMREHNRIRDEFLKMVEQAFEEN